MMIAAIRQTHTHIGQMHHTRGIGFAGSVHVDARGVLKQDLLRAEAVNLIQVEDHKVVVTVDQRGHGQERLNVEFPDLLLDEVMVEDGGGVEQVARQIAHVKPDFLLAQD